MRNILLLGILELYALSIKAQSPSDSTKRHPLDSLRIARNQWHAIIYYDIHSTFTANAHTLFKQTAAKPQLLFYYNLDVKSRLHFRKWLLETNLFNDYGFTWFIDSMHQKTTDHLNYKFSVARQWNKHLSIDAAINTQTVLYNGFSFRTHHDTLQAYLSEAYMSPGFIHLSTGIGFSLPHQARLQIGLAACKISTLRNSALYASRQETSIAGIPKGKKRIVEGGLNAQLTWPLTSWKERWYAEGTALVFIPLFSKQTTLDVNTVFHWRLWRFGRISWRHQFQWNKAIQPMPSYQQWLTLGCYLNNKLQ